MLKFILLYLIIAACFYVNVNHASAPNCSVKPELTTRGPLGISGRPGSKGEPGKGKFDITTNNTFIELDKKYLYFDLA